MTLKIDIDATAKGQFPHMYTVNYGVTDSLAAFCLSQLVNTLNVQINNTSISTNLQDVLPALLRMSDPDDLAEYESTTPTTLDYLANYRDGVDRLSYQILASSGGGGVTRAAVFTVGANTDTDEGPTDPNGKLSQKFISYNNNVLSYDQNRGVAGSKYKTPRGSFVIKRISTEAKYTTPNPALNEGSASADIVAALKIPGVNTTTIYVDVQVTEPLLMSPFIFGTPQNHQGFYGIANMTFQMNLASNANRAWRSVRFKSSDGTVSFNKTATIHEFASSSLTFTFLTAHPTQMLPSRNIVPFYELPVYRTQGPMTIPKRTLLMDLAGQFSTPPTYEVRSNNIQLNQIPDKLIIFCKRLNMTTADSDSFLTIENVNINFNNNAGLLSSMTKEQLYKASVLSGLKNMSWQEFSGITMGCSNINYNDNISESREGFSGVGAYAPISPETYLTHRTAGCQYLPTVGSMLVLNFGEVIQLTEDYYAPGSLGSFNLQVTIKCCNHQIEDWPAGAWELIIITMNSGVFVCERGTSSVYSGLLTRADVLDASEQEHYSHGTVKRMIGGSLLNNLKSSMAWISSKLPFVKNVLGKIDHPYARAGHDVLKAVGYGRSGGGSTGGNNKLENRLM
jgi:hypothetical protein